MLLAGEDWVSKVDSVTLSAGSVGGFTEPEKMKQTFTRNKNIVIERLSVD